MPASDRYAARGHFSWLAAPVLLVVFIVAGFAHASDASDKSPAPLPALSISVLQFGTAHWELDHILHRGLDRHNGYRLELKLVANLPASRLAVTSGSVNGAVADLLWAQSRFQAGTPYLYVPFSSQIGDIVVPEGSGIRSVADLAGTRIGVAGGPDSKGWILLRKVAGQQGISLDDAAEVQFAAPPLLSQALKRRKVDAIVTYWHFAARLRGEGGWRSAFGMADLLTAMDLDRNLPVLGYVFPAGWAEDHRPLMDRFAASLNQAKVELAEDDSHWQRLRPLMGKPDEGIFQALKDGFIAGTPAPLTDQRIADLHRLLALTGADSDNLMPARLLYRRQP
ncbi:ABC transporter substrate-binding protein [Marinobacter orientalis]|uniref:ABC transporter substrate-binding protein n=1 Tax=Marinobacter orientalis TaxID=1928859 RepID=A0A7Y0NIY2_9GAMM|nr:ABC transporter substrate-binding protein [Marinobacter orientalis]NMT62321.1 ABC transporter substrate-binding protein [Marinobacter orientalis]TGX51028.1 ABC transporter substrate-binding protein [Marinobacter orientalis]